MNKPKFNIGDIVYILECGQTYGELVICDNCNGNGISGIDTFTGCICPKCEGLMKIREYIKNYNVNNNKYIITGINLYFKNSINVIDDIHNDMNLKYIYELQVINEWDLIEFEFVSNVEKDIFLTIEDAEKECEIRNSKKELINRGD